jgi:NDP-sugar pyrophosphorylase family protein
MSLNILIPMAGKGSRFENSGYTLPKPLIPIEGKTMIENAVDSLGIQGNFIFVTQKSHALKEKLESIYEGCVVLEIDYITDGPACTALLVKDLINNDDPLLITNCDQIMWWDDRNFKNFIENYLHDGFVVTYTETTNKNSYVELDRYGMAKRIVEKEVISDVSLNGIHFWKKGKYFIESSEKMIQNNERYNNEFYIGPSYNELIKSGKKIGIFHIPNLQHNAVGTPEDLIKYTEKLYQNEGI